MPHHTSPRLPYFRVLGLIVALLTACKPPRKSASHPAELESPRNPALAAAWIDSAKTAAPEEALALLVSALKADPTSEEALTFAETILSDTQWSLPILTIKHPFPIEQLAFSPPSSLWVSLAGDQNTTMLWNLDSLKINSVLFPVPSSSTRCLVFDSAHRFVVIERGSILLLCDALTLKPIRELDPLPEFFTPSSVIVFSPDGLLMAHPTVVSPQDTSKIWQLRDVATGEILRTSEPLSSTAPQALSATLDRKGLRVLHTDGSLMEMPVSPVEAIRYEALPTPLRLLRAQFSNDGKTALALQDQGPHRSPIIINLSYGGEADGSLDAQSLAQHFPWTRQPSLWNGLIDKPDFQVKGTSLEQTKHAPIHTTSPISAVVFQGNTVITGEENGRVTQHQLLPHPATLPSEKKASLSSKSIEALEQLSIALSGSVFESRHYNSIPPDQRLAAMKNCDFTAIRSIFPHLDFSATVAVFESTKLRHAETSALLPLTDRLAQTSIAQTQDVLKISQIFHHEDPIAIFPAIRLAGGNGPAAATALALALESDHLDWIEACLATAIDLPPLLTRIARSRIALIRGQKADALAEWPEIFPELAAVRLREDWVGWEQADFEPALAHVRQAVQDELTAIQIPQNSTPKQRKAVIAHLSDPQTVESVGKRRFAEACLKAALMLADLGEDTPTAFQLANFARNQGADPESCLRVEAIALTNLGDYKNAHTRWIELITEHPIATQQPGDYAEAAYTSFENSDPGQAMEILTTGIHRFPKDGNFALRAGWVALLTGNSEKAYRFLREGQRIGFPQAKLENAAALLTIAASQTGADDDAKVYFNDLLKIDAAWNDPTTLDSLDWPDELKSTLRQFMQ